MSKLPPDPYVMQSQSREALYEAQQAKVEPIPPFVPPASKENEGGGRYLARVLDALINHYNTHVVARLNSPPMLVADPANRCEAYINTPHS